VDSSSAELPDGAEERSRENSSTLECGDGASLEQPKSGIGDTIFLRISSTDLPLSCTLAYKFWSVDVQHAVTECSVYAVLGMSDSLLGLRADKFKRCGRFNRWQENLPLFTISRTPAISEAVLSKASF
jgi:hypothetical protein